MCNFKPVAVSKGGFVFCRLHNFCSCMGLSTTKKQMDFSLRFYYYDRILYS